MPDYTLSTKKTWDETIRELADTFDKWGVRQWRTDPQRPPLRANQYHGQAERTVTLYYTIKGREVVLTSSKQSTARDNLRVLYLVVEALRMNERRGLAETAADAYRQTYPALPAPGQTAPAAPSDVRDADPYAVLWLRRGAPRSVAEAVYRALAKFDLECRRKAVLQPFTQRTRMPAAIVGSGTAFRTRSRPFD